MLIKLHLISFLEIWPYSSLMKEKEDKEREKKKEGVGEKVEEEGEEEGREEK